MAKRNNPNYRGILGRPINPWREDLIADLDRRRRELLLGLGIDADARDADAQGAQELSNRHGKGLDANVLRARNASHILFALAAAHAPGFRLATQGYNMRSIYMSRHPETRLPELPFADITILVRAVNAQSQVNARGRRSGIKRAINAITATDGLFSHLRRHRHRLEWMYHRHRRRMPPLFPSLTWCARPNNEACFASEVFFDEAPSLCRAKQRCHFWKGWEEWASYFAAEYVLERRVLIAVEMHRRLTSRRRRT